MDIIKVKNLSVQIANNTILRDITFNVKQGEVLAIIGSSGVGKSTLLKCMGGLLPYLGNITISNCDLKKMTARDIALKIAWLHQSLTTELPYTTLDFVAMSLFAKKRIFENTTQKDREIVLNALRMTDAAHLADRFIRTLSGGEKQRVYLAATIAQGSEIIFLDEPTSFMDVQNVKHVFSLIEKSRSAGKTVVVVTHDINFALHISDRILALKDGELERLDIAEHFLDLAVLKNIFGADFEFATTSSGKRILSLCY